MEEYELYRDLGLTAQRVGDSGKWILSGDIDWNYVDSAGRTNAERVMMTEANYFLSPLDENGVVYDLHHVGQENAASWAVLSSTEHESNHALLHFRETSDVDHGGTWTSTKRWVYQALLRIQDPELYASLAS